jgi:hypothetical protein
MLYKSLLGIFSRLGPALHGRQLSLLNSLYKFKFMEGELKLIQSSATES